MSTATQAPIPSTLGRDNGIGDFFSVDVKRGDERARIVVCAPSLQHCGSLLGLYADIYGFSVLRIQ